MAAAEEAEELVEIEVAVELVVVVEGGTGMGATIGAMEDDKEDVVDNDEVVVELSAELVVGAGGGGGATEETEVDELEVGTVDVLGGGTATDVLDEEGEDVLDDDEEEEEEVVEDEEEEDVVGGGSTVDVDVLEAVEVELVVVIGGGALVLVELVEEDVLDEEVVEVMEFVVAVTIVLDDETIANGVTLMMDVDVLDGRLSDCAGWRAVFAIRLEMILVKMAERPVVVWDAATELVARLLASIVIVITDPLAFVDVVNWPDANEPMKANSGMRCFIVNGSEECCPQLRRGKRGRRPQLRLDLVDRTILSLSSAS